MTATDGLSEILSYDGEPDAGTTLSIALKDDDFGLPNIVKKIYGVVIEYSSSAAGTGVYAYTDDKGVAQGTATIGTLPSTSGDMDINRFNFNNNWYKMSVKKKLEPIKDKVYLSPKNDWDRIKNRLPEPNSLHILRYNSSFIGTSTSFTSSTVELTGS